MPRWRLNFASPKSASEKEAIGSEGKVCGKYGDYLQEAQLLASLIIDIFAEESAIKPLLMP